MNVLFLSRWFPYPPNNGSKIRVWNILQTLAEFHHISLVSFVEPRDTLDYSDHIQISLDSITEVLRKTYVSNSLTSLLGFLSPYPRSLVATYSKEMAQVVSQKLRSERYDLIIVSQWEGIRYIPQDTQIPILLDELELALFYEGFQPNGSYWANIRQSFTWWKHAQYVKKILNQVVGCTVVSKLELGLVEKIIPNYPKVAIIPNGINLAEYPFKVSQPYADTIIFTGSLSYRPNYQAVVWFIDNVLPKLKSDRPNIRLLITGRTGGYQLPPDENIQLTGYVDDIKTLISRSTVSIAPIFSGGGTRYKILEAMALGTPVIATRKGVEGLDVQDQRHLIIADNADDFANEILRLMNNSQLRETISREAYDLVASHYDWQKIKCRFLELIDKVAQVERH